MDIFKDVQLYLADHKATNFCLCMIFMRGKVSVHSAVQCVFLEVISMYL